LKCNIICLKLVYLRPEKKDFRKDVDELQIII